MQFADKIMWAAGLCCLYGVYVCFAQGLTQQNLLIAGGSLAVALLASVLASGK